MLGWAGLKEGIGRLLSSTKFADRERTRAAWWLNLFLLFTLGTLALLIMSLPFSAVLAHTKQQLFAVLLALMVMFGGVWVILRQGFVRVVAAILLVFLYLGTVLPLLLNVHTISHAAVIGFFILIPAAGLLFGRRVMVGVVASAALTLCVLYLMEAYGLFLAYVSIWERLVDLVLILIGLSINTAFGLSLLRDTQGTTKEVQQLAAALAEANYELDSAHARLRQAQGQSEARALQSRPADPAQANLPAEAEVREQWRGELRFRNLAENSPDFISIWDIRSHRWEYCNRSRFLGHASLELLSAPVFFENVHPDDQSRVKARWLNIAENVKEEHLEYRLRNASGGWEWIQARERVLSLGGDGAPAQVLVSLTVITDRKNYEETLRLAKESAEAASRAKNEFLANVSHEIRTPINGVVGMASLLQTTGLTDEQRLYVDTISHSSDALLTVVNDILDLSKAESGRLGIERKPFEVSLSVEDVLDLLTPQAAEKNLELVYSIDRSVPVTVLGDAARLRQVLINLVSNAIKFTEHGEVSVLVDAKPIRGQQVELHFAIQDTGIGIAPHHLQQLFQPFSQVDTSSTRRYGGTGLGLVLSKRLCEMMGGSIWVESEQQVGSTFHFTIVAPIVAPIVKPAEAPSEYDAHPALVRRTALVVDDNPAVRRILQQRLSEWGMVPTLAASGAEALALMREHSRFDVVVIDMQMPGMSGLTLAKELRKLAADLPIVMTSALGVPMYAAGDNRHLYDLPIVMPPALGASDPRETVRQLGVKSIVFKPVKPSVMRTALLAYFDSSTSHAGADEPDKRQQSSAKIDPEMGRRHPLQILLAEDNLTNRKVALRMLERLGYAADVAVNGAEALAAVRTRPYDVILMDIQMPEMDGLEATRRIRTDLSANDQPHIIAMTAAVMQLDREKCLAAGMDDFVAKPARLEDLAKVLERFLPLSANAR